MILEEKKLLLQQWNWNWRGLPGRRRIHGSNTVHTRQVSGKSRYDDKHKFYSVTLKERWSERDGISKIYLLSRLILGFSFPLLNSSSFENDVITCHKEKEVTLIGHIIRHMDRQNLHLKIRVWRNSSFFDLVDWTNLPLMPLVLTIFFLFILG